MFLAFHAGYANLAAANMSLICEVSTFFLNYRSMYAKDEMA
jgi:hypothetical protein